MHSLFFCRVFYFFAFEVCVLMYVPLFQYGWNFSGGTILGFKSPVRDLGDFGA
jgi:hypothetical protein